jgi:DNA-binding transcriptional regulator YhcF (GntR family)
MNAIAMPDTRAWPPRDANGRTNQKVRTESREALANETPEYMSLGQRRERLAAFRKRATELRERGKRRGAGWEQKKGMDQPEVYSTIAADVLDYLMFFAVETGRVFPSYEQIAAACGCAYRTAVRTIHQLRRGGWIYWERRFVRTRQPGEPVPQVEQTSNLYRLAVPTLAGQLIAAWRARRAPNPEDAPDRPTADDDAREDARKRLVAARAFMDAARSDEERQLHEGRVAAIQAKLDDLERGINRRSTGVDNPDASA